MVTCSDSSVLDSPREDPTRLRRPHMLRPSRSRGSERGWSKSSAERCQLSTWRMWVFTTYNADCLWFSPNVEQIWPHSTHTREIKRINFVIQERSVDIFLNSTINVLFPKTMVTRWLVIPNDRPANKSIFWLLFMWYWIHSFFYKIVVQVPSKPNNDFVLMLIVFNYILGWHGVFEIDAPKN